MDFKVILQSAKKWVETSKSGLELVGVDESERKLTFGCGAVTFYVIHIDSTTDTANWSVWSDADKICSYFQTMLERVDSAKEITDVLNYVHKGLTPLLGASADDSTDDDAEGSDDDEYYADEDWDCSAAAVAPKAEDTEPVDNETNFVGNPLAVQRLLKDLKSMKQSEKFGVKGTPRGDNLFIWDVQLIDFEKGTKLSRDLLEFAKRCKCEPAVYLEMKFPEDYPMAPPFVRVLKPRFRAFTGHITVGGSVCMEMLTKSGWTPSNDIESILVQIRTEIMSDARASLDFANIDREYEEQGAHTAFNRMVTRYGWNK